MRIVVSFILVVFLAVTSVGQNLRVDGITQVEGRIGSEMEGKIAITNISDETVTFTINRVESNIGTAQSTWFCLDDECFDKSLDKPNTTYTLKPGESFSNFRSILKAGLSEGFSSVKYEIRDISSSDLFEPLEVELTYTIVSQVNSSLLYSSPDIVINEVYPNPVSEFAIIDYSLKNKNKKAKIVLHSVLGSVLEEYELQPLESKLKISVDTWNPGVYFYTLYIDNDGVMTRKMVVRK